MPVNGVDVAVESLGYPALLRLATRGGWMGEGEARKAGSAGDIVGALRSALPANRWVAFARAVVAVSSALPTLSVAKIRRYCEVNRVTGIEFRSGDETAVVDLYLRNPERFQEVRALCEVSASRDSFSRVG